jgi:hypothetical protein
MSKIIIEVRGGSVVAVHSDDPNVQNMVWDWDNIETGESAPEDFMEPDSCNSDIEKIRYELWGQVKS